MLNLKLYLQHYEKTMCETNLALLTKLKISTNNSANHTNATTRSNSDIDSRNRIKIHIRNTQT